MTDTHPILPTSPTVEQMIERLHSAVTLEYGCDELGVLGSSTELGREAADALAAAEERYNRVMTEKGAAIQRASAAEATMAKCLKRQARLEEALRELSDELDAFWNEPPEVKYVNGRMSNYYENSIVRAQMDAEGALRGDDNAG